MRCACDPVGRPPDERLREEARPARDVFHREDAQVKDGVVLEVEGVSKSFGALAALADVSLTVRAGEVFSVIGPNGAGKSTLFNVVAGPYAPTAGRVVLQGEEI